MNGSAVGDTMVMTHDNGARACVDSRPDRGLIALSVRVAGGAAVDPLGKSGLAHLFEHLMCTGTRRLGRDGFRAAIEDEGASSRARTGVSWTTFSTICTAGAAQKVLDLEIERFGQTTAFLDSVVIEREKSVVLRERSQRLDGAPYGNALEHLLRMLYGDSPYGRLPVGIAHEVRSLTKAECLGYFARAYAAPNIAIAVSGDVAASELTASLDQLMDSFPAGRAEDAEPAAAPSGERVHQLNADLPPKLYLGYLLPAADQVAFDRARLGAYLLGKGEGSYLRQILINRNQPVLSDVKISTLTRVGMPSAGVIEAVPADGVPVGTARGALLSSLDEIASRTFAPTDINRAQADYRRSWYRDDDTVLGRANGLSLGLLRSADPARYYQELDPAELAPALIPAALEWWNSRRIAGEVIYT